MAATVKDIDRGYKALFKRLKGAAKPIQLTVGVHADDGAQNEPGGATVLEVATWNEFGTARIPERSFIRAWADENAERNRQTLGLIGLGVINGKVPSPAVGLERAGLRFVAEVQAKIVGGVPPPNAPSTIEKKGSSTPLVDSGQLKSSIRHKVGQATED